MKKAPKKLFSFEHGLNFENLSQLLNDTGIVSKPLSNEQKVCIEYPNISSESTNINIINDKNENLETENTKENKIKNDFTIILSKEKNFTLDVNKLYNKLKKNFIYTKDIFTPNLDFITMYNDGIIAVELLNASIGHSFLRLDRVELMFNSWDCESIVVLDKDCIVFE